jgi:hypothetical protein
MLTKKRFGWGETGWFYGASLSVCSIIFKYGNKSTENLKL